MTGKEFRPIVQVLNFLRSSSLLSSERLVLIELSSHVLNIYTPGTNEIAKNTGLSNKSVFRALSSLTEKGILQIEETKGLRHKYTITIPQKLSTTSPTMSLVPPCHQSQDVTGTGDMVGLVNGHHVTGTGDTMSPHIKRNSKNNKKEREQAPPSASPSLPSFCINNEHANLAIELGVDVNRELVSFRAKATNAGNLDLKFMDWLMKAHEYNQRQKKVEKHELRSTVKFWGIGHPDYDRLHGKKRMPKKKTIDDDEVLESRYLRPAARVYAHVERSRFAGNYRGIPIAARRDSGKIVRQWQDDCVCSKCGYRPLFCLCHRTASEISILDSQKMKS